MRRRDFITLIGGATVIWPLTTRAQQAAIPVVSFLNAVSPEGFADRMRAFRQGLRETGTSRTRTWRSTTAGPRTGSESPCRETNSR